MNFTKTALNQLIKADLWRQLGKNFTALNSGKIYNRQCTRLGSSSASHLLMYGFNFSHLFGTSENNDKLNEPYR